MSILIISVRQGYLSKSYSSVAFGFIRFRVPMTRLELARDSSLDPKSSVSAIPPHRLTGVEVILANSSKRLMDRKFEQKWVLSDLNG